MNVALLNALGGFANDRLTASKAHQCIEKVYSVTGFVLRDSKGNRVIIEDSAVRWLSNAESYRLMHGHAGRAE